MVQYYSRSFIFFKKLFHAVITWYPIEHGRLMDLTVCDVDLHWSKSEARCHLC